MILYNKCNTNINEAINASDNFKKRNINTIHKSDYQIKLAFVGLFDGGPMRRKCMQAGTDSADALLLAITTWCQSHNCVYTLSKHTTMIQPTASVTTSSDANAAYANFATVHKCLDLLSYLVCNVPNVLHFTYSDFS